MDICIDFDGTCVSHQFPAIGKDIGAIPVLKELVANGHKLILFTMRCDQKKRKKVAGEMQTVEELYLTDAMMWFENNEIPLYGIQKNPKQKFWTKSPKAYGNLYIDDAALGCPLVHDSECDKPYVDWIAVRKILVDMQLIAINIK